MIKLKLPGADTPFTVEDTCYNQSDWRSEIVNRTRSIAYRLASNELGEYSPEWVDIQCEFTTKERSARIANVEFGTIVGGAFKPFSGQEDIADGVTAQLKAGDSFAADFSVIYPDGSEGDCYIESIIPDKFPRGRARLQLRGGAVRMPVDRGLTPYLVQSYYKELDGYVRYFEPTAPKSKAELYEEIDLMQNGGALILELLSTGKGMRNVRGKLPRCFSASSFEDDSQQATGFKWLDYRGFFSLEIEIVQ